MHTIYVERIMLEKETAFYTSHREELRSRYAGKRIVIADDQVLGVYDSDREAIDATEPQRPLGTFMVKYIPIDPNDEIIHLYTPFFAQ
jgi:hypothetical protein